MARIEAAMQNGRYAVAGRDLSALLDRPPDSDRAAYLLGVCEKASGRPQEADAAWARIPPDVAIRRAGGRGPDGPAHRTGPAGRCRAT